MRFRLPPEDIEPNTFELMAQQRSEAGPPMTLGNMRQNGVRRLRAYCYAPGCHHEANIDVESWPDDMEIPSIGPRLRCQQCGARSAEARPNWIERGW
jgi:hypothetical protein